MEVTLRLSIPHWRPDTLTLPASMDLVTRFELAGFPSGHAFRSAFVFGWLGDELKTVHAGWARLGRLLCVVMIVLVGFSRLYLNRHWASDVLGSWLVALVAFSIARCWEGGWPKTSRRT
jgi:membrane-associated phospholipid phosphatase